MKKIHSKTISVLLAALLVAGSLSTYASDITLDYEVESGDESAYIVENTSEDFSIDIDFSVEQTADVKEEPVNDDSSASLMGDIFEGSGTENDPYIISTADDLILMSEWITDYGMDTDCYYKLGNDIDLGGVEWKPIGDSTKDKYLFKGVFDGNGKTISNFKITKNQLNIGFFGVINNATIKNLTVSDFEIDIQYNTPALLYVGGIVGRAAASGADEDVIIQNCHVKDAKITATSGQRIYGSGHSGYLHSSDYADLYFKNCTTNAECSFTVYDSVDNDTVTKDNRSMIRAGGIIGYVGITGYGRMNITNCVSNASVFTHLSDISSLAKNDIHTGGFAGDFAISSPSGATATRSSLYIDSCYSTNMVYTVSDGDTFAGGFTGYLVSTVADVVITNCHTNSNVYATSTSNTSYIGGFSSIAGIDGEEEPLGTIDIQCVYASGNVIDINSKDSLAGKITAYVQNEPKFRYTFAMADSVISAKAEIPETDVPDIKVLSAAEAVDLLNYTGFDIDTWVAGTSPYPYPVLAENPLIHGNYKAYYYASGAPVEYMTGISYGSIAEAPSYIPDSVYEFSHWSLYRGGPNAIDGTSIIKGDTIYFPNNSSDYKSYVIIFYANGAEFHRATIQYGSPVEFPVAPPKPADSLFRYAFSHWSGTENGSAVDTSTQTVRGDAEYYAVYEKIESDIWDGISTNVFANGTGSEDSPYEIADAYNLAYLASIVNNGAAENNAHYIITKDIDLGGYEWTPIGTKEHPFTGTLNGNGYSIYNFNITSAETEYAGVFGYVSHSDISKLEVSGFRIRINTSGKVHVGPVAAYVSSTVENGITRISQCYTEGEISITAKFAYVGGIAGFAKDIDLAAVIIENCYSTVPLNINTTSNSTVGGIIGSIDSENVGLTYIDKCYYSGDISFSSDVGAYCGGIAGNIVNDSYADEASLAGEIDEDKEAAASVRNSFYAGNKIEVSLSVDSFGGAVYGRLNEDASVYNCGYIEGAIITAVDVANDENVVAVQTIDELYDAENVSTKFGFDFENIWLTKEDALPVLRALNQIKDVFRINEYALNKETGTLDVSLKICYRDIEKYLVLVGAYNANGKMIGFRAVLVTNPSELQTIDIPISGVENAVSCTLSVVDPLTMALIESPRKI